jgi:hypothetical protein
MTYDELIPTLLLVILLTKLGRILLYATNPSHLEGREIISIVLPHLLRSEYPHVMTGEI